MGGPTYLSHLHDYQAGAIERIEAEIAAGRRRLCLVAPTGAGKTVIAAAKIADAVKRREHVVFVGHRRELTEQTSGKLYAAGVEHGIVQAGFATRPGAPVQVCSIQTLHARAHHLPRMPCSSSSGPAMHQLRLAPD